MAQVSIMGSDGRRVLAGSLVRRGPVTVVSGGCGRTDSRTLGAEPDLASARRWLRVLRRIDRVEIDGAQPAPHCKVHAVGHRHPVVRPVSLGTALGLALLGVPLLIETGGF